MKRSTLAVALLAALVGLLGGLLLSGQQGAAIAQEKPPDITDIVKPSPVVAALTYQAQTDYEQDPFEPTKLRRTTMRVRQVLIVRQDGAMEIKEAP